MNTYHLIMRVRQRGAIGIFYPQHFYITMAATDRDGLIAEWQRLYGETWEPSHLVSWEEEV